MQTDKIKVKAREKKSERAAPKGLSLSVPTKGYREVEIPGFKARLGVCFVRVTDLPGALDNWLAINPRVPSRLKSGVLGGPVVRGIQSTLLDSPEEMALKNNGIFLLVKDTGFDKVSGELSFRLEDKGAQGIVNGGHTFAAIRELVEGADEDSLARLSKAYVRLHVYSGIDADQVPEIAEGLNRNRSVDEPSLINLQGHFDSIRKSMRGQIGEEAIAYHQGDSGSVYISEVLVYLEMFNAHRFAERRQPNGLYNRASLGVKYFTEDLETDAPHIKALINRLPDILKLADQIRKAIPAAARANRFKLGMAKLGGGMRAGGEKAKGTPLPFLGEIMDYRIPNGWLYGMLAAFRANLKPDAAGWYVDNELLLASVIEDMAAIVISEHKDSGGRPEIVGKRESAYSGCYRIVQLYLAKKGHIS